MQTEIFLLRHGTTQANMENRFAGRTAEPLHHDGAEQIRKVADTLRRNSISRIFCGPLPRTRESAHILSKTLEAPVIPAEPFNEIHIPHWDGLTKQEIKELYGDEYPTWLEKPDQFNIPACETLQEVQHRAVAEVEAIFSNHRGEQIVLVSHLIVIRCLALHYLALDLKDFRQIIINNSDLSMLRRSEEGKTTYTSDCLEKTKTARGQHADH